MLIDLLQDIKEVLCQKAPYFPKLAAIAEDKKRLFGATRQFKTEKWLEVELATGVRDKERFGCAAQVDVDGRQVDLVYWELKRPDKRVCVELKSYQDSGQSAGTDAPWLQNDANWALAGPERVALALLPGEGRGGHYTENMLEALPPPIDAWDVPLPDEDDQGAAVRVYIWYST